MTVLDNKGLSPNFLLSFDQAQPHPTLLSGAHGRPGPRRDPVPSKRLPGGGNHTWLFYLLSRCVLRVGHVGRVKGQSRRLATRHCRAT